MNKKIRQPGKGGEEGCRIAQRVEFERSRAPGTASMRYVAIQVQSIIGRMNLVSREEYEEQNGQYINFAKKLKRYKNVP